MILWTDQVLKLEPTIDLIESKNEFFFLVRRRRGIPSDARAFGRGTRLT